MSGSEAIIEAINGVATRLGKRPTGRDCEQAGISDRQVRKHFGGWTAALNAACVSQENAESSEPDHDESRLVAAQATIRSLNRQVGRLRQAHGEALEFNDDLLAALSVLPPLETPPRRPAPAHGSEVGLVVPLGDWHAGEVIKAEEMDGFNEYNWGIGKERMGTFVAKVREWAALQRKGYIINRVYIPVLGDLINGDIHIEEYLPTNEFPVPVQTAEAGRLLASVVLAFAADFSEVIVDCLGADNHGRRTKRPASKTAAQNNHNYLIYEIAKGLLSQQKRVTMRFHLPLKAQIEIEGRSVLASHGHENRAWMGIPYYGIERAEGREARKRMRKNRPYTFHLMAHWHQYVDFGGYFINPALCGSSEYDAVAGRFGDPGQATFLMHRTHGHFSSTHWRL